MEYYWLEAEVAGGFGDGIDYRVDREPRVLPPMRYEFQGWHGGHIVTTTNTWIATRALSISLREQGASGIQFSGDVVVTKDPQWEEFEPDVELPEWEWITPNGVIGIDDLWINDRKYLAVSRRALDLIEQFGIGGGAFYPLSDYPSGPPRLDVGAILEEYRIRREGRS